MKTSTRVSSVTMVESHLFAVAGKVAGQNRYGAEHVSKWGRQCDLGCAGGFGWRPHSAGEGMAPMIVGWARYADAYHNRFESPIGEDGILGAAWKAMGESILVNGDLAGLNAGSLDALIRGIMANESAPAAE